MDSFELPTPALKLKKQVVPQSLQPVFFYSNFKPYAFLYSSTILKCAVILNITFAKTIFTRHIVL